MATVEAELSWSDNEDPIVVESGTALRKKLSSLATQCNDVPTTAMLRFPDGALLFIGVGRPETRVLIHEPIDGSERTAEWTSLGNPDRAGDVDFWLFGHHTPHLAESVLPLQTAIDCAVEYLETRRRSSTVQWEEDEI